MHIVGKKAIHVVPFRTMSLYTPSNLSINVFLGQYVMKEV